MCVCVYGSKDSLHDVIRITQMIAAMNRDDCCDESWPTHSISLFVLFFRDTYVLHESKHAA